MSLLLGQLLLFALLTGALIGALLMLIAGLSIARQFRLRRMDSWQTNNLTQALGMLTVPDSPRPAIHRPTVPLSMTNPLNPESVPTPAPQPTPVIIPIDPQITAAEAQRSVRRLMDYLWAEAARVSQQAS